MKTHILITGASRGIGEATAASFDPDTTTLFATSSKDGDLNDPATPARLWARALDAGPSLEASADDPELRLFIDTTLQAPAEELSGIWALLNAAVRRLPGT